jgi:hypothetical protein
MNKEMQASNDSQYVPHTPARPMKVIIDDKGTPWLCDKGVDPEGSLAEQGCWNCGEIAFTRND